MRGLRKPEKRRAIFSYLKHQKATISCLQETFSKKEDKKTWSAERGGKIIYAHGSEHSRNVCILINPNSTLTLECIESDPEGRYLFAKLKLETEELSVVKVYAPTDYCQQLPFLRNLIKSVVDVENLHITRVVMAGDWNKGLNHLNKSGGLSWKETNYRNGLVSLMQQLNMIDIYCALHPNTRTYTYKSKSLKLKSRIDFFLIPKQLLNSTKKVETRSSIVPDHKAIYLCLQIDQTFKQGPGNWKFNNTLLKDKEYVNLIKNSFPSIQEKYHDVENKQLYWELLKMEIRSKTISYSKTKKRELQCRQNNTQCKLEELDWEIRNKGNLSDNILNEYDNLKTELKEIYDLKGQEAIFRSKVKWIEYGEKPTKYFFNLEKRNYERKVITKLKPVDGEIITDSRRINEEIENFYKSFLISSMSQEDHMIDMEFNLFPAELHNQKLSDDEQEELEYDVTKGELLTALKGFKPDKNPGDDGFTKEFYKTFFKVVGDRLLDSFNDAFKEGKMSVSQRRGAITLIPKDENDLTVLNSWQPLTLLNVDYKILARVIAKRVESKLSKLIHSDQTGFVKGRFIGKNVRLLNDLMEYTELKKVPGILLFIDFEKAFDTLEWHFIQRTSLKFLILAKISRNGYLSYIRKLKVESSMEAL